MGKWQRRTIYYVGFLAVVVVGFAALYQWGMATFDDRPQPFLRSLRFVVETFTTTGYGSDSPWNSTEMRVIVIVMDLVGTVLIFLALPVLAFPLLEDALSTEVPTTTSEISDHIVICTYTTRAAALITELESLDVPYVIVEPDRERARELYEDDHHVVHADPESIVGLEAARVGSAQAVVADVADEVDASIVLAAREVNEDVQIVSVVQEPARRPYHELAGADEVLSPRPLLGEALAAKVTSSVRTNLGDAIEIGDEIEIAELPIRQGTPVEGETLGESGIREEAGVSVIAAWVQGEFDASPSPDTRLTDGTVLLVVGPQSGLDELVELTRLEPREYDHGEPVVVGHGQVGQTVTSALAAADTDYTVVDQRDTGSVDVIGDATDPAVLRKAGVGEARSVILALPDDTITEFAALIIRDIAPETKIIARVDEPESVRTMYRAGADYVLSLARMSGRMVASTALSDEDVLSLDQQVQVARTHAPGVIGQTVGEARVGERTGCTIVGVERGGEVIVDIGADFRIEDGDELVIAGPDERVRRFSELME